MTTTTLKSRPDLVDLRSLTDRWRIRRDARGEDRGLIPDNVPMIPGRRGHIEAADLTTLGVYVTGRGILPKLLRALPAGWRRHQVGDHEANLLAPLTDLDQACRVVRAFRCRKLSPEAAAAGAERFRKARESHVAGQLQRQNVRGGSPEGSSSPAPITALERPLVA